MSQSEAVNLTASFVCREIVIRFLLLSLFIVFAVYLILLAHGQFGLRFAIGVIFLVVGLCGFAASIALWLRGRG